MNKKDIRLIAIDLDDTLLRDDNTVSDYTKQVMSQVRAKGIEILIATGRMYQTAAPVARTLGLGDSPMMLFSGGVVQRVASGQIIAETLVPLEAANKVLRTCKEHDWYVQAYVDDQLLIDKPTAESRMYEEGTGAKALVIGEELYNLGKAPNKLLLISLDASRMAGIKSNLQEIVGSRVELVRSKPTFLEIIAPGVSKGGCLRTLLKERGLAANQVVAFGNSDNDISMLEAAGYSLAVANAEEGAKKAADDVCRSNQDDGVAHWLEKHIL